MSALEIRVRGRVQGVGFRPTIFRLARELALSGRVANDAEGVLIHVSGAPDALAAFLDRLEREPPPLARVETVDARPYTAAPLPAGFHIADSTTGTARTQVAPDAAVCAACAAEVLDPFAARYRYPFTTCTHCGPRLSVVLGVPYDRARTTMAPFDLCPICAAEYADPTDRRFHAETTACHGCGPRARLVRLDGRAASFEQSSMLDDVDAVSGLLQRGEIVAVKGLGGYQLACDATRADVVAELRRRKQRDAKPFALMARDLDVIRRYATPTAVEVAALGGPEAPIVLLLADGPERLPDEVAPGLRTLGFMLPTTPLHLLILRRLDRPVVMTSGNLTDEPQVTGDDDARARLAPIAAYALVHDRDVAVRVDDSVVRVIDGAPRLLRRARGHAPGAIQLPPGFEGAPPLLACGGELKATFCLVERGEATLSQHLGDLEDAATFDDYRRNLALFATLFDHRPEALVVDRHPDYLSAKLAREQGLPVLEAQHHHAHVAACLAEHGRPLAAPPVIGLVVDGLGYGDDGALWGGEVLVADYLAARRVGTLKPVAMLGGAQAAREPWRNLYAHLMAELGWPALAASYGELELFRRLEGKPRALLDGMLRGGVSAPLASSCGRLFDAVAAALDLCFERQAYEGQAAMRLEALVGPDPDDLPYPFAVPRLGRAGLPYLEPKAMWSALLGDLILGTDPGVIAGRFHRGLARALAALVRRAGGEASDTVALSGGCFANKLLFEETARCLRADGYQVLGHARVPPGDGGLALGQAAIGAARLLAQKGSPPCA